MVRDCLSLPNLLSAKTPRESAHIINTVKFKHDQNLLPYSAEQIIEYHDVGQSYEIYIFPISKILDFYEIFQFLRP